MSGILFVVQLIKGKEYHCQSGTLESEDLDGKTMGIFLRMMRIYFSSDKYVILYSDFCVFKGFIQLMKKGIFACAVIKKRRYWTSMVPGKYMEDHFGKVEMGETDSIQGTVDDVIYNLWGIKGANYVIRMMDTGGLLLEDDA